MVEAMERGLNMAWDVWEDGNRYLQVIPADMYADPGKY
jgi:hypothetical protein